MQIIINSNVIGGEQSVQFVHSMDKFPKSGAFKAIKEVVSLPYFTSGDFTFQPPSGGEREIHITKQASPAERKQAVKDRKK